MIEMIPKKILLQSRLYHGVAFFDFYEKATGEAIETSKLLLLKKKYPDIDTINHEQIKSSIQILKKYNISDIDACHNPHLFRMNPITMDNYGEILKECGFKKLSPEYIIRYHTHIRSRTIAQLKKKGLLSSNEILEKRLLKLFPKWPASYNILPYCLESKSSLLDVRMKILKCYLSWRLKVTEEEFNKYCKLYLPIRHKPMVDIQTAIDLANNYIRFDETVIRRNGFIIAADPVNTKLIIENVPVIAGLDILEVLKIEPAIIKTNYTSLQRIIDILKEYRISEEFQRKNLKIFCLRPETVRERFNELANTNEFNIFVNNPRVLSLVIHKKKMMKRINKIQAISKNCFSLNNLVASSKVFNSYINNLGDKACGRDIATLIYSSLDLASESNTEDANLLISQITKELKRHKYTLRVNLNVIHGNMKLVKKYFTDDVIIRNCQLVMYPLSEIETYLNTFIEMRKCGSKKDRPDLSNVSIDYRKLSDDHIMSLIQYELEKNHHFTDDGIWGRVEQKHASGAVNR